VHPYANLGHRPRKAFVIQLKEARAEWHRRHSSTLSNRKEAGEAPAGTQVGKEWLDEK
jgi:hypothetical protein